MVVEQLHLLLTLVVSLSASIHRLRAELNKKRTALAQEAEVQAARHSRTLKHMIAENGAKQEDFEKQLANLKKDSEAVCHSEAVTHEISQTPRVKECVSGRFTAKEHG